MAILPDHDEGLLRTAGLGGRAVGPVVSLVAAVDAEGGGIVWGEKRRWRRLRVGCISG